MSERGTDRQTYKLKETQTDRNLSERETDRRIHKLTER